MIVRKLFINVLFLALPLIFIGSAHAQMMGGGYIVGQQQAVREYETAIKYAEDNTKIQMTGDGNCEFNDAAKAKVAQKAQEYLNNSLQRLREYNAKFKAVYDNSDGVCHDLKGDGIVSDVQADAVTNSDLNYNHHAQMGARYIDSHLNGNGVLNTVNQFNKENGDTDYNVKQLISKVEKGKRNFDNLLQWYKSAGKTFNIDDCLKKYADDQEKASSFCNEKAGKVIFTVDKYASEMLEQVFHYSYDCKYAFLNASGQLICSQTGSPTDGIAFKCGPGNSNCSSPADLERKIQNSPLYTKCLPEIMKLNQLREAIKAPNARTDAHRLLDTLSGEVEVVCQCPENESATDKKSEVDILQDCNVIDSDFKEDSISKCKTISGYAHDMQISPVSSLLATIIQVTQKMSKTSFDVFQTYFSIILGIALAIYILFVVLKTVSSPTVQKTSELLQTISIQGAKVAFALLLLASPKILYGTFVWPIVEAGLDASNVMTFVSDKKVIQEAADRAKIQLPENNDQSYLPSRSLQLILGAVDSMQLQAATMPALGSSLLCNAWVEKDWKIFPHVTMWFEGAIIYIFGWIICLVLGFYLIDCIIQLAIVCALMPFFILSWPFKLTAGYTKQGWEMLLNTALTFTMMGIVTKAISVLATLSVANDPRLTDLLDAGQAKAANDIVEINFGGKQFIMLIVCCVMCMKMPRMVSGLVNRFARGADLGNMGGKLLGAATQVAMAPIKRAIKAASTAAAVYTGGASKAVTAGVKAAGSAVKKGIKQTTKQITQNVVKNINKQKNSGSGGSGNNDDE